MRNPFTIGSMIQNPAEFVGRTAAVAVHLLTRLRSLQSCSVVAERRMHAIFSSGCFKATT